MSVEALHCSDIGKTCSAVAHCALLIDECVFFLLLPANRMIIIVVLIMILWPFMLSSVKLYRHYLYSAKVKLYIYILQSPFVVSYFLSRNSLLTPPSLFFASLS